MPLMLKLNWIEHWCRDNKVCWSDAPKKIQGWESSLSQDAQTHAKRTSNIASGSAVLEVIACM